MINRRETEYVASDKKSGYDVEPLRARRTLQLGIDVGSTSSDVVVLDGEGRVIFSNYRRTKGKPVETIRAQLSDIFSKFNRGDISLSAATGSAGRFVSKLLEIPFVNEVPAQAAAIYRLYPHLEQATIVEMGGQDSKLVFLAKRDSQVQMRDFALNTVCAAGTGSFLDQQAQRLGVDIEGQFGQMAIASRSVPRMAGRCSVFAKSDMIHLQQQATPVEDIIAGLCLALARNLKSNLGCGREFVKPIIFTGGVAANIGVVRALEEVFELPEGELLVPDEHFFTGAIGAVLVAKDRGGNGSNGSIELEKIDRYLVDRGMALRGAPRRERIEEPSLPAPESPVHEYLLDDAVEPIEAYIGIDVGSLSTNVAVIDGQNRILAKAYLMTAGRPLEAVRSGLEMVGEKVVGKVRIAGAATTGSGRYLTGDFIGADQVINEITAQAAGAAIVNPKVDTIFEIGGQDSKYISLENGVVVDFEMNHACAAGTGSFLEEQAQRLGISIKEEFAESAFRSEAPIKLGERCTVFMESDLLSYQQQGASTEDLVAGLSYSIVTNYLNRVVGRRKIGENICFQGGTAFNKAVWAAFEMVTGKAIMVPDHHEVTGALGAASIAAEYMVGQREECGVESRSKFRGFENLTKVDYTVESFTCEHCSNNCEIKKVQLLDSEPLYYGSRCDRYNLKKKSEKAGGLDAFGCREKLIYEFAGVDSLGGGREETKKGAARVGIPMSLQYWQMLPLFSRFFEELGFEVVLSGKTSKRIIRSGVEAVSAQTCFPVKVAYGHVAELIKRDVDYIFMPSIVSMTASFPQSKHNQLCPYVQSIGYQSRAVFADRPGRSRILTTTLRLGEGERLRRSTFLALGKEMGVRSSDVRRAMGVAFSAQDGFDNALKEKGREILGQLGADEKLFVLVSRPYNGCDQGMNLELPRKLSELGIKTIPMDMLDLESVDLGDSQLHERMYWSYGQKILRAAELIRRDRRLFAIYLSNFSCGPDSFLLTFFKDIMGEKPCLQLEIDEHSADAGVITRLEAFLESLKNYRGSDGEHDPKKVSPVPEIISNERTLYIPYMGDCSYGVAASLRAYGQPAEVMPMADEATLHRGRAFTTGKECLPCIITTGDMLKVIESPGFDAEKAAFFMPSASGPCRFGMYSCLHRKILNYSGVSEIPVIAPNQDSGFYQQLGRSIKGSGRGGFLKGMWIAVAGIDLLGKLLLRLRPFASDRYHVQQMYDKFLGQWVEAAEQRRSLSDMVGLMGTMADYFGSLRFDKTVVKPRIGIVGEIYVRSHPFSNMHLVRRLEELGAACDLASLAEWIYYTNYMRCSTAKRRRHFGHLLTDVVKNSYQRKIEKVLAEPLEKRFGRLVEGPVEHVLGLARPYLHESFEGEAVLSAGKIVEYYREGFGGVLNVMPFSCMPSTVVSTQTRRISSDCNDMPILNLSFDGQEDPTMMTRLEAFVEQVRQRQCGNATFSQIASVTA